MSGQSHSHAHGHAHGASSGGDRAEHRRRLAWALGLATTMMILEVVGGLWTGSLALLADAGHMLSDSAALALSLFAVWLAERPAPAAHTFGFRRFEILAALANGVALIVVAIFIAIEAFERLGDPREVLGGPMLLIATAGLLVNVISLGILHGGRNDSLNLRGAWLHVASDALGSVGAIAAGAAIALFGWQWADPVASVAIAALVLHASWALLRETVDVLLEAAPGHLEVGEIDGALHAIAGVDSVHDLHVWTITSGMIALSCHVRASSAMRDEGAFLTELQHLLAERFDIHHVTIQVEPPDFQEKAEVC